MNGRGRKVKSWLQDVYQDVGRIQDIFNHNLIASEDIGHINYLNIVNRFEDVLVTIEDVLFELDNK